MTPTPPPQPAHGEGAAGPPAGLGGLLPILLLALALRTAWLLACPNEPVSDQTVYHAGAWSLARGAGFSDENGAPIGWWPPGYSALLAPVYLLLGPRPRAAHGLNLLLGLAGTAGLFLLGGRLFGLRAGRLAGLLLAVHPTLVLSTTTLSSELPLIAGLPWLLLLFLRGEERPRSLLGHLPTGLLLGLLVYIRPTALLLAGPCLLLLRRGWRGAGPALLRGGVLGAAALLALLPWGCRNQARFGVFSPLSLNGASNLWQGNHEGADGGYADLPPEVAGSSLAERERELGRRAFAFIRENPGAYLGLCLKRTWMTLRTDTIAVHWNEPGIRARLGAGAIPVLKVLCTSGHWALLLAAAALLAWKAGRRRWRDGDPLLLLAAASQAAPFVLIVGGNRYFLPLIPLLLVWVAQGTGAPLPGREGAGT